MYTKKCNSILLLPIEETPIGCEHLNKSTELFENLLESRGPLAKRRVSKKYPLGLVSGQHLSHRMKKDDLQSQAQGNGGQ